MSPKAKGSPVARSRFPRWYLVPVLLLFIGLLSVACTPSHPQSTFDAAGPVARSQLNLFYVIFWAAVFVFVVVEGILVYAVIRFRRKPNQEIPAQTHGNTPLEIAWTIAPAIVLAIVAVPTIITIFDNARTPSEDENPVHVNVTAHQWWWEFEYFTKEELDREEADLERIADLDTPEEREVERPKAYRPKPYLVTANELHVPIGVPVSVVLESTDVIHSFWVPKLAGKVDIVPNNRNTMWFQADEPGMYLGQCAEFCGISHANMKFRVMADTQEGYDRWVKEQQAPPAEPTALALEGQKAYIQQQCWACHTIEGVAGRGDRGPNLTHVASRTTIAGGMMDNDEDNCKRWLADPLKVKPGNIMGSEGSMFQAAAMPRIQLDIEALCAYLQSLK